VIVRSQIVAPGVVRKWQPEPGSDGDWLMDKEDSR